MNTDAKQHPVRFTYFQMDFLKHAIYEILADYWEDEALDLLDTIEEAEKERT